MTVKFRHEFTISPAESKLVAGHVAGLVEPQGDSDSAALLVVLDDVAVSGVRLPLLLPTHGTARRARHQAAGTLRRPRH